MPKGLGCGVSRIRNYADEDMLLKVFEIFVCSSILGVLVGEDFSSLLCKNRSHLLKERLQNPTFEVSMT